MTPADLEGLVIGPVTHRVDREHVGAFIDATGDDAERWLDHVPPGYAAVLLFAVAGPFLTDPRISPYLATLVHVDQQFTYPAPIAVDSDAVVMGTVERVRERGGVYFVTFAATATVDGEIVLESRSTFLMSDQPAGDGAVERSEPGVDDRGRNGRALTPLPLEIGTGTTVPKSASRGDLVRYAAVTGDYNPLHWDHDSARAAGLGGVVVHGLLMLSWLAQHAAAFGSDPAPVATIKVRFRSALYPADAVRSEATIMEIAGDGRDASVKLRLAGSDGDVVTGSAVVRLERVTP